MRSFFWSVFSRTRIEYGDLPRKSLYLVWIRENADQKKCPYLDTFHIVASDKNQQTWRPQKSTNFVTFLFKKMQKTTIICLFFAIFWREQLRKLLYFFAIDKNLCFKLPWMIHFCSNSINFPAHSISEFEAIIVILFRHNTALNKEVFKVKSLTLQKTGFFGCWCCFYLNEWFKTSTW